MGRNDKAAKAALDVISQSATKETGRALMSQFQAFVANSSVGTTLKYKDKRALEVCLGLIAKSLDKPDDLKVLLQASLRLLQSPQLVNALPSIHIRPWSAVLGLTNSPSIVNEAVLVLGTLIEPSAKALGIKNADKPAYTSKDVFTKEGGFEGMVLALKNYGRTKSHDTLLLNLLNVLHSFFVRNIATSPSEALSRGAEVLSNIGPRLFELARSQNKAIKSTTLAVVRAIFRESTEATYRNLQKQALSTGAWIGFFADSVVALPSTASSEDKTNLTHAREVFGLMVDDNPDALSTFRRTVPEGLTYKLNPVKSAGKVPPPAPIKGLPKQPTTFHGLTTKARVMTRCDWEAMWGDYARDFEKETLIWNKITRSELREKVNAELTGLEALRRATPPGKAMPQWDWRGWEVNYDTLAAEVQVGPYYLRKLKPSLVTKPPFPIRDAVEFVRQLYDRLVIEEKVDIRLQVLSNMAEVVRIHHAEVHSVVPIEYLCWILRPPQFKAEYRVPIVAILEQAFRYTREIMRWVRAGGIPLIVAALNDAHSQEKMTKAGAKAPAEESTAPVGEERALSRTTLGGVKPAAPPTPTALATERRRGSLVLDILYVLEAACMSYRARQAICDQKSHYFQWIVQTIMSENFDVTAKAVQVLNALVESYVEMHPYVHKTGAFEFVLANMDRGVTYGMVNFLRTYHRKQANPAGKITGDSYLAPYLPLPLIELLDEVADNVYATALRTEFKKPSIIWKEKMRVHLARQLRSRLVPFVQNVQKKADSLYVYVEPEKVEYSELSKELFVGGMYIRLLNANPDTFIKDPAAFNKELVRAMATKLSPQDKQMILASQSIMSSRYPGQKGSDTYEGWPTLLELFTHDVSDKGEAALVSTAADSALSLLTSPSEGPQNIKMFLRHKGVPLTAALATTCMSGGTPGTKAILLKTMKIAGAIGGTKEVQDALLSKPELVSVVVRLMKPGTAPNPQIALEALKVSAVLSGASDLQDLQVKLGALLYLLQVVVVLPHKDGELNLIEQASKSLAALSGDAGGTPINFEVRAVLKDLLTENLHQSLRDPGSFMTKARMTNENPLLIWNKDTREELGYYLDGQAKGLGDFPSWNLTASVFKFTTLADTLPIGGVYVHLFNKNPQYSLPDHAQFVSDLINMLDGIYGNDTQADRDRATRRKEVDAVKAALSHSSQLHPELLPVLADRLGGSNLFQAIGGLDEESDFVGLKPSVLEVMQVMSAVRVGADVLLPYVTNLHLLIHTSLNSNHNLCLILNVLTNVAAQNGSAAERILRTGVIVSVLSLFCSCPFREVRELAAKLLGALVLDSAIGETVLNVLGVLFSPKFDVVLRSAYEDPPRLVNFYNLDHDTPVLVWNNATRKELLAFLRKDAVSIIGWLKTRMGEEGPVPDHAWDFESLLNPGSIAKRYPRPSLERELVIGAIYVRNFNANPFWKVDQDVFLAQLVAALRKWFEHYRGTSNKDAQERSIKFLNMMWEAVAHILDVEPRAYRHPDLSTVLPFLFSHFTRGVDASVQVSALKVTAALVKHAAPVQTIMHDRLVRVLGVPLRAAPAEAELVMTALLDALKVRPDPTLVNQLRAAGMLVFLVETLMGGGGVGGGDATKKRGAQTGAAKVIMAMAQDETYGASVKEHVLQFLTPAFAFAFESGPDKFVDVVAQDQAGARKWNADNRAKLLKLLEKEGDKLTKSTDTNWDGESERFAMKALKEVWSDWKPVETAPTPPPPPGGDLGLYNDNESVTNRSFAQVDVKPEGE